MAWIVLFVFGLAIGSFMNVLALRYDGEHFLFDPKVIGGRSRCPHCTRTLRWFELVPVASFLVQRGRCRNCSARIGIQYPLVELLSGAIFVFVPLALPHSPWPFVALWVLALETLLLIAYIDLRLQIIPDELTVLLALAAIFETVFLGNAWTGHTVGALFGAGFFGLLALATRGRGMGMGDVKLGLPLGFLFGWPNILLLYASAFVIGAAIGVALILTKKKSRKSEVPFAPFLVLGAYLTFFFGASAIAWYFRIIGL